ncbi:spore germination protein [Alkalibaculum sp. M08DMB]|uniref:Spore germination protein n=1 Tax=Alkalibaculum sporogenes TaxID=2655001 RepID=A0A6A7KCL0_9FIRM|nr:spore germination protein [Alkalibaculum sporogenes]MPW27136.1 spore germination protein [Alkalibaculum sporogenes]
MKKETNTKEKPSVKDSLLDQWVENLEINSDNLKKILSKSADFISKPVTINSKLNIVVHMFFIDGLINHQQISELILKPLVNDVRLVNVKDEKSLFNYIEQGVVYFSAQNTLTNMYEITDAILSGNVVIIFNELNKAIAFDTKGFQMRSITTPTEETSLKGSKDTFVETIRVNTATVRRKIKSTNLIIEDMTIGYMSNTLVSIVYMDNMVSKVTLNELIERLKSIDTQEVIFPGIIEEHIIEDRYASFPQVNYTEKPDKFCISVLDGKIGLIIDGIPFTLILPTTIVDFFQTTDDYTSSRFVASAFRIMRYTLAALALFITGYFITITTFHQLLLPPDLAISIITSREGVPFPMFLEIIVLVLAFQVLIEAGTRIYSSIGGMVTLVGALVVGDAAVNAKFVSPAAVVVVAIAAIANYAIPNRDFANSLWLWQFIMILLSSIIGLFGLVIGLILLVYSLASVEVLGVPYLSPFVNSNTKDAFKDSIIRPPLDKKTNPDYIQRTK